MFILIIRNPDLSLALHLALHPLPDRPDLVASPSDAGVKPDDGGHVSTGVLADGVRSWTTDTHAVRENGGDCRPTQVSAPVDMGAADGSLLPSDGLAGRSERLLGAFLPTVLGDPSDLFPPNRITARCSRCGHFIPRFEGYRQNKIGVKRIYCHDCQELAGLPLRGGVAQPEAARSLDLSLIKQVRKQNARDD